MYDEKNASGVPDIFFSVYMMQRGEARKCFFVAEGKRKWYILSQRKCFTESRIKYRKGRTNT